MNGYNMRKSNFLAGVTFNNNDYFGTRSELLLGPGHYFQTFIYFSFDLCI